MCETPALVSEDPGKGRMATSHRESIEAALHHCQQAVWTRRLPDAVREDRHMGAGGGGGGGAEGVGVV